MIQKALALIVTFLIPLLPKNLIVNALGSLLDLIETEIKNSQNKYDDIIVLPVIGYIRETLNIQNEVVEVVGLSVEQIELRNKTLPELLKNIEKPLMKTKD